MTSCKKVGCQKKINFEFMNKSDILLQGGWGKIMSFFQDVF